MSGTTSHSSLITSRAYIDGQWCEAASGRTPSGLEVSLTPHAGVGSSQYAAPGWKAGDATSWEEQMRTRTQSGQNEYVRSGGK